MLKQLKQEILKNSKTLGLFTLVHNSRWRRERLLILAYHGISLDDEHNWDAALFMSADQFRERLQLVKDYGCTVLPLSEALRRLFANELPEKSVSITFDDGFYNFYKLAYPILKGFGFPVTLYLTTYYSYHSHPIFNLVCSYLLWKGRGTTLDLRRITGQNLRIDISTGVARATAINEISGFAQQHKLSVESKDTLAESLAEQLNVDYGAILSKRIFHLATPDEVSQLASEGIDIQLHTHRHRSPLDHELFHREIEDNRRSIREITGSSASHFCYPSGFHGNRFLPWLEELEVISATTCEPGLASPRSNRLLLPRLVDSSGLSPIEFEGWITGVSSIMPRRPEPKRNIG